MRDALNTRPAPAGAPRDEAGQSPLPAVTAALTHLGALDGAPLAEHVEVFDTVHRLLQDALATLDEA